VVLAYGFERPQGKSLGNERIPRVINYPYRVVYARKPWASSSSMRTAAGLGCGFESL